jgi:hypothetical protein
MNKNITKFQIPTDKVRVCHRNTCIEARGNNGKLIAGAFAFALLCVGLAALAKTS